ncbi:MAG TPA: SIMPL domain-containing protein [Candidatus Dormibacteraeota bacterium]|nr:SIMPL domain-containing protein [Candidatus Dormibacteraeota bacterium]
MSVHTRVLLLAGLSIAVAAAVMTATVVHSPTPSTGAPPKQVLSLAASSTSNTITVVGVGTASAVPDAAELDLGVSATRPSVRDAVSQATADMNHLLSAIRGQGVQDKDIQTASISIYQQTNCCPQTVTGYTSSNSLTINVHHVSNVTPIMEAAIDAVGNDLQMNGISLSVSDPTGMNKSARAAAMSDATARAKDWAGLTGHHVGGLLAVSEIIAAAPAQVCQGGCGKGGAGGGVPIQPGQTTITVTVAATYELVT